MNVLSLTVLATGMVLAADAPDAGSASAPSPFPAYLEELFQEKGDDGQPILSAEDRAQLEALPEHALQLVAEKMNALTVSGAPHLKRLLSLRLTPQQAELVFQDNCIVCHTDPDAQKKANLFSPDPKADGSPRHMSLKNVLDDVHFRKGLSCSGCHGGSPKDEQMTAGIAARWPRREERQKNGAWVVEFCGRCHSDPSFMRGFNPGLPTDQVAKYRESHHGQLVLAGDNKAAQCVSCHGVHGILRASSPRSTVNALRVPEMCGHCHADAEYMKGYTRADGSPLPTDQFDLYRSSVHGKALLERNDTGAPACNDCHGNHAAQPPEVTSVAQVCRTCHANNGALFDGSKHKLVFEKNGWPECGECHGHHEVLHPTDEMLSSAPDGQCGACHQKHAKNNPECSEVPIYFRSAIEDLAARQARLEPRIERYAELGHDVEAILASAGEVEEALVQSRTRIHSFDRGTFDLAAEPGRVAAQRTEKLLAAAEEERRYRRNGLLAAIATGGLLALALGLKIRQIDRKRRAEGG